MNKETNIFELYTSDDFGNGAFIFTSIYNMLVDAELTLPNWLDSELTASHLDYDYCAVVSGDKKISYSALRCYDKIANGNFETFMNIQSQIIFNRFNTKWSKLFEAINQAYDPLENYSMYEKETPNLTDTSSANTDIETENSVSSYDSSDLEPVNKTHTTGDSNNNVVTVAKTGTRELERSGNIGVTTSQQMLESEFEVRKHDIYMIIYNDIDTILTNMKWG